MSDGYEPDFDIDNGFGKQGELFVVDIMRSLGAGKVEVKTESYHNTNMYVETEHLPPRLRRENRYVPSGLTTTKAEVWAFVHGRTAFVVPVVVLRECVRRRGGRPVSMLRGNNPTRGYILPMAWVMQVSAEWGAS